MPTLNSLQATAIKFELDGLETVVGALYHSPSKPFVEEDFDKLIRLSVSKRFILGGDLNCKHTDWNSRVVTRKGKQLAKHADKYSYAISAPDRPTYYSNRSNCTPDVLDILLHHVSLPIEVIETLDELNSDHNPVLVVINTSSPSQILSNTHRKEVRWDVYRDYLKEISFPQGKFESNDALELGIEALSSTLVSARKTGEVEIAREAIPYFPDLSQVIAEKRRVRKRWQKYKLREDKIELNRLTNLIHDEIRDFRASNFEKEVQKEYERNTVWNVAGRLKGSRNITNVPIHGRDGLHYQPEGKTTAIAECLEDQFQANDTEDGFRDHYKLVRREVHRFRNTEFEASVPLVTSNEVRKIIKNLRPKKAPGHDGVTNSMIKQLPCHCIHHLTTIYNSALNLQYFPESWKRAQVITFPKPGKDPKFPQNRRPISLLDCLGKIYERILLDRLMVTVRGKNLVPGLSNLALAT